MDDLTHRVRMLQDWSVPLHERERAFGVIVERFQDMAFAVSLAMLGDKHLAEDAAQEAFLIAWREIGTLVDVSAFPGWFKRIVVTQCHRFIRRKRVTTVVLSEVNDADSSHDHDPQKHAELDELRTVVSNFVQKLPEHERIVTTLFYMNDLSIASISEMLGLRESTVKKRLHEARKRLADDMFASVRDYLHDQRPSRNGQFVELVKMLVSVGSSPTPTRDGQRITQNANGGYLVTGDMYQVPVKVTVVAKTSDTNIRIRFARSEIIFNWENNMDTLRWVDPATGKDLKVPDQGRVPVNEWVVIEWDVRAEYTAVRVNGQIRYQTTGNYEGLAGQVGIGTAHGSTVTIKSFVVEGEKAPDGIAIEEPPRYEYDGGVIDVLWENHQAAIEWYTHHMGWSIVEETKDWKQDATSQSEKMTALGVPRVGVVWIKSVKADHQLEHLYSDRDGRIANTRWCFNTHNLKEAHSALVSQGIRTTGIYRGPDGRAYFDFWAFEDTRLTASESPDMPKGTLFSPPSSWMRIGVTDLDEAIRWYKENLDFEVVDYRPDLGFASARTRLTYYSNGQLSCLLEKLPLSARTDPVNSTARPYFHVRNLDERKRLVDQGTVCSKVTGLNPGQPLSLYHFYDPYGNRINAWYY